MDKFLEKERNGIILSKKRYSWVSYYYLIAKDIQAYHFLSVYRIACIVSTSVISTPTHDIHSTALRKLLIQ